MRVTRPALCLALAVSVVATGAASAATKKPALKPVCNLVTDAVGDAYLTTAAPAGSSEPGLDIKSADIAASTTSLTAVIRVSKLASSVKTAPTGFHFVFTFTAPTGKNPLYLQYFSGNPLLSRSADFGYDDPAQGLTPLGDAIVVLDTAKNEIRLSAPISGFAAQASIRTGQKLGQISVASSRDVVVLLPYADSATSDKTYTVGTPSCVKP